MGDCTCAPAPAAYDAPMRKWIADALLALGVVVVIFTGVVLLAEYNPGGHSTGMARWHVPVLLMVWGSFALSLFGLVAMYRMWRRS